MAKCNKCGQEITFAPHPQNPDKRAPFDSDGTLHFLTCTVGNARKYDFQFTRYNAVKTKIRVSDDETYSLVIELQLSNTKALKANKTYFSVCDAMVIGDLVEAFRAFEALMIERRGYQKPDFSTDIEILSFYRHEKPGKMESNSISLRINSPMVKIQNMVSYPTENKKRTVFVELYGRKAWLDFCATIAKADVKHVEGFVNDDAE